MITVTSLTGAGFALNPDLIERVESCPETVVTLVNGGRYVVAESVTEVIEAVRSFRAAVLLASTGPVAPESPARGRSPQLRPVRNDD